MSRLIEKVRKQTEPISKMIEKAREQRSDTCRIGVLNMSTVFREGYHIQKQNHNELSPTEKIVLNMMATGLKYSEIAQLLNKSLSTIRNQQKSIFIKLQTKNRTQAIIKGLKMGLISL
jgi:DNA-binding NarL/FixJ family response regulator